MWKGEGKRAGWAPLGPLGATGVSVLRPQEPQGGVSKSETPSALYFEELLLAVPRRMTLEREESRLEEGEGLALVRCELTKEGHSAGRSDVVK